MISKRIELWDNNVNSDGYMPYMDTYVLSGSNSRGAVLILPGGGYQGVSPREAEPIAIKFNNAGYHAFVLYYSVFPNRHPQPLRDASRAMSIIRSNAQKWGIISNKIAVCGFSAGGHLAASLGVHWNKPFCDFADIVKGQNRPDALILSYPVISSGEFAHRGSFNNLLGKDASQTLSEEMSLEKHVDETTPPSFIWHTLSDTVVPVENSLLFASALREKEIPFELHIFPQGPHGLSLAIEETSNGNPDMINEAASSWIKLCIKWLNGVFDKQ